MEYLKYDQIKETFGEELAKLAKKDSRVNVTSEAVYVELSREVTDIEGKLSKVVRVVEPTVLQLRRGDEEDGQIGKAAAIFAACSNLTMATVNGLKGKDFLITQQVVGAFL